MSRSLSSRNSAALAQTIRRLVADSQLRWRMGQAGRERVMRLFPRRLVLEALVGEYEGLSAAHGIAPPARRGGRQPEAAAT